MALSDKKIFDAMNEGNIVIEPFNIDYLSTSSYDVCLGEYFYREQKPDFLGNVFNIYDQNHVQRIWGEVQEAKLATDVINQKGIAGFRAYDKVIVLAPGETILAHTQEFIGGRNNITTMMKARSSLGRSFITVCKCAGWGDVGYVNRWTMEITNVSSHYHIPLLVGERIAQIVFFETGEALRDYSDRGNYQNTKDVEQLKRDWKPESMLPRTKRKVADGV